MPPPDRRWPAWEDWDVPSALAISLLALALVALEAPASVRTLIGLPALFLAPGYAVTGAFFLRRPRGEPPMEVDAETGSPMSGAMRFGLGIALSTALLILAAIAVEATGPLRAWSVLGVLAAVAAVATATWYWRVSRLPRPMKAAAPPVPAGPTGSGTLAILLVAAMALAGIAGAYVLLKPRDAPEFTALYLVAADGVQHCFPDRYADGAYGVDPREKGCGDLVPESMLIGVANHEGRTMDYWLRAVWTLEALRPDNSTDVLEAIPIGTWQVSLDSTKALDDPDPFRYDPQYELPFELPPPPGNGSWRMSVQLYTAEPPAVAPSRESMESPYKRVHLIIRASGMQ